MSGAQRPRKAQALSKVLVEGFPDAGTFENIPKVKKIAPESHLPYVALQGRHESIERLTIAQAHAR